MNRLDPAALKTRLFQEGIRSNQDLGQHFLIDESVLEAVIGAGSVQEGEVVVEIGPGPGVLTERLLERGARVEAFELDPAFARIIRKDFASHIQAGQLSVYEGDAIQILPQVLAGLSSYKVVANIPYQITTPLLQLFLERFDVPKPQVLSLLIQREVAERLSAKAGDSDRSFLSVLCQYYAESSVETIVPPTAFTPPPAVDSAVILLKVRNERLLPQEEERAFFKFVRMGFQHRRKQLKNVLSGIRGMSVAETLATLGLPASVRAQELTNEQWIALYKSGI